VAVRCQPYQPDQEIILLTLPNRLRSQSATSSERAARPAHDSMDMVRAAERRGDHDGADKKMQLTPWIEAQPLPDPE
jgi:hypothetical protein